MNYPARRRTAGLGLVLACWLAGPAAAAVRLEIAGAPDALRDNIRAHVGALPTDNREANRALQRRIRAAAEQGAQALGYYNSRFDLDRQRDGEDVVYRLEVTPGPRTTIAAVEVELAGEARADEVFLRARERLPVAAGQPLDHGEYEAAKQQLQNLALRRGYFDARFTRQRVVVDAAANTARVELSFDSGPRYRIGEVTFSDTPFRPQLLESMVPFEPGEPYQAEQIVELNRQLLESGYFGTVQVRPLPDQAAERRVPVQVNLSPVEPNRVGLGLGYSTDVGPRAQVNWRRRWVNRRGHSAGAELEVSELRQTLEAQYRIPWTSPIDDVIELQTGLQDEEFQDTDSERFTLSLLRRQNLASGWQRTLSVRWDYTDFIVGDEQDVTRLLIPGLSFTRTRTRGGVDPVWGDRLLFGAEATEPALGSDISLRRVRVGGRWLRALNRRHRFLLRADAGGLAASDFDEVPPSLRFFAGGDQSVRGYAYNSIAPVDEDGDIVGGRYLLTGSAEYGFHFRDNWRLALFVDAGNAADDWDIVTDDVKVGTGFGIHWISPVGPIRLDLAWGVSEEDVPFRLHFSMGPQL